MVKNVSGGVGFMNEKGEIKRVKQEIESNMMNQNVIFVDDYEINPNTLYVKPIQYEGKMASYILELDGGEFITPFKPIEVVKRSCEFFGYDYEGQRKGTKSLTGYTHKAPIEIERAFSIFIFPTSSPDRDHCMWIAHSHVDSFSKNNARETMVTFRNKRKLILSVSYGTFETQLARTAILKTKKDRVILETRRKYHLSLNSE